MPLAAQAPREGDLASTAEVESMLLEDGGGSIVFGNNLTDGFV